MLVASKLMLNMKNQKYIIVKDDKVIRSAPLGVCPYAANAIDALKPDVKRGEKLYVEVVIR